MLQCKGSITNKIVSRRDIKVSPAFFFAQLYEILQVIFLLIEY